MITAKIAWELSKPRIALMQIIPVTMGYGVASGPWNWMVYIALIVGSVFTAAGAGALNQWMEQVPDAKMVRTAARPLPTKRVGSVAAIAFGSLIIVIGFGILLLANPLSAIISIATIGLYLGAYTPLKQITWMNTWVGAIPGALPPIGGWIARSGHFEFPALILFFIMFFWQLPHFFSIAILCKSDYRLAGFKMLPGVDQSLNRTNWHILGGSLALLIVSVIPVFNGELSRWYGFAAATVSAALVWVGLPLWQGESPKFARRLLRMTIVYLPLLTTFMLVDRVR